MISTIHKTLRCRVRALFFTFAFVLFSAFLLCKALPAVAVSDADQAYAAASSSPISLSLSRVHWISYSDYVARTLSVDVLIGNSGDSQAFDVTIEEAANTHGVTLISDLPLNAGDIAPWDDLIVTLKYRVPAGVAKYSTGLTGRAWDVGGYSQTFTTSPAGTEHKYGTPRIIASFLGTLDCDYPAGLTFDTEGPAEDRPVTDDGVALFGYFRQPETDPENPRPLPYVFLRENDANRFDHRQPWWMAMEIELGYGYNDVSPCITFDWFNITTPNELRTGTVNNEGFVLDYYSRTGVLSSKKIAFWRLPNDEMGHTILAMPSDFQAGDIYRVIVHWSPDSGLAFHLTPVSGGEPMSSSFDTSFQAKIPIVAENPFITISGGLAWDGLDVPQRSYQDNSKHRYFILANGDISDEAVNDYMQNPAAFIAEILKELPAP